MADLKISQLTGATTPLAGTEVVPLVQSSTTKKVAVSDLTAGRPVSMSTLAVGVASPTAGFVADIEATRSFSLFKSTTGTQDVGVRLNNTAGNLTLGIDDSTGGNQTGVPYAAYLWNTGNYPILVATGNAVVGRFDTNGNYVPATAAKGVNFTANTPAAGMTSQLLNWYEEGTCSFTVTSTGGTLTTASASAVYTRVGRVVTITGTVTVTTNGTGTGALTVAGLPFTPATAACGVGRESVNNGKTCSFMVSASSTSMSVQAYDNTYPVSSGSVIQFSVSYSV